MNFEEVFASLPSTGWLSRAEAELLWRCCELTQGPILEVGCYHGRSTCLLASFKRQVICVDPFEGFDSDDPRGEKTYDAFAQNLVDRGIGNVTLIHRKIEDAVLSGIPFGFCFLDGDHTYLGTMNQVRIAKGLNPRIIAVHDVNDGGEGLEIKRACLELLGPWAERAERLAVWAL